MAAPPPRANSVELAPAPFDIEASLRPAEEGMSVRPSVLAIIAGEEVAKKAEVSRLSVYMGPLLGLLMWLVLRLVQPEGMTSEARILAGLTTWMATWWMTEALPMGTTSMLPLATYPIFGVLTIQQVVPYYSRTTLWLMFGGIVLAMAVERTGLHRRIALNIIGRMGTRLAMLQLGLNLAVSFLSMFVSNTSSTVMLLPITMALVSTLEEGAASKVSFKKPFVLGLAYSASCGGLGTLIGTPPNLVLVEVAMKEAVTKFPEFSEGIEISFFRWCLFGVPVALTMVLIIWAYFTVLWRVPFEPLPPDSPIFEMLREGSAKAMSGAEKMVAVVFSATVICWLTRDLVNDYFELPKGMWSDEIIAMIAVILLFILQAEFEVGSGEVKTLLDWDCVLKFPWELFFLFGGGFAMAGAFGATGLSSFIGASLEGIVRPLPDWGIIGVTCFMLTYLTEITSNTATATVWLPIVADLSYRLGKSPLFLMIPCTVSASCAFMLPVATPPNAVVFASGYVTIPEMAKTGFLLSLMGVCVVTIYTSLLGPVVFDFTIPVTAEVTA